MSRGREKQLEYNAPHGIEPATVRKSIEQILQSTSVVDAIGSADSDDVHGLLQAIDAEGPHALIGRLEAEMIDAAKRLEFERAASLRDRIEEIRSTLAAAERMGVSNAQELQSAAIAAASASTGRRTRGGRGRGHR